MYHEQRLAEAVRMVYYLSPKDISIRSYDQKSVNCHTCSSFWALVIANAQLSRTLNSRRISACGAVTTVLICYKSQVKSSQGSFLVGGGMGGAWCEGGSGLGFGLRPNRRIEYIGGLSN